MHTIASALLVLLFLAACGGAGESATVSTPAPSPVETIATVTVTAPSPDIASAGTMALTATITGSRGTTFTDRPITWQSSDTLMATVSNSGVVTAKRVLSGTPGTLTVTATVDGRSGSVALRVLPVPVATLTFDLAGVQLATRDVRPVRVTARDATGAALNGRKVTWTSSNVGIARVDSLDRIEGLAAGSATLTARVDSAAAALAVTVIATETYAIPVDPALTDYPWGYRTPNVTSLTQSPPCDLAAAQLIIPRSWMGSGELPPTTGAPLASSIQRGIGHKDVWQVGNPSFAQGCSGDVRQSLLRTMDRIKAIGADYITLTPWTFINIADGVWSIRHPDDVNSSIIGDVDLTWAVQQAKARGLKVHWMNQIQGGFQDGKPVVPAGTVDNVTKFLAAYEPYMLERAAFLQRIGVDVMQVSCVCWTFLEAPALAEVYGARMAEIVPKIRAVFRGGLRIKETLIR